LRKKHTRAQKIKMKKAENEDLNWLNESLLEGRVRIQREGKETGGAGKAAREIVNKDGRREEITVPIQIKSKA